MVLFNSTTNTSYFHPEAIDYGSVPASGATEGATFGSASFTSGIDSLTLGLSIYSYQGAWTALSKPAANMLTLQCPGNNCSNDPYANGEFIEDLYNGSTREFQGAIITNVSTNNTNHTVTLTLNENVAALGNVALTNKSLSGKFMRDCRAFSA